MQDGDYYRLLTNGYYAVSVTAPHYKQQVKCVTVKNKPHSEAQRVDFKLTPGDEFGIGLRFGLHTIDLDSDCPVRFREWLAILETTREAQEVSGRVVKSYGRGS